MVEQRLRQFADAAIEQLKGIARHQLFSAAPTESPATIGREFAMKTPLIVLVSSAACFAAGYWVHSLSSETSLRENPGPVSSAMAARSGLGTAAESGMADAGTDVRAFASGRPFVKGKAREWILSLAAELAENGGDFEIALADVAQVFMTMDESSATEVAKALQELLALHAAGDPALRAIDDADDMANGALMITIFRLSQLNPAAAVALLKDLPGGAPDEAYKLAFARMASHNVARAEAMLGELSDASLPPDEKENRRRDALQGILHAVAAKDPTAALALAEKYPDISGDYEYQRIIDRMMKRDPQQGIAAAIRMAEKGKSPEALRGAMESWMRHDKNAATAWAEKHTGPGQTAVQAYLLEQRVKADPEAAAVEFAKLQQIATDQKDLESTAGVIAQELGEKDTAAARAWATSLPAGLARERALHHVVEQWVREDATGASAWITTLPPGKERDSAAVKLVDAIKRREPADAFEWARNIQDEGRRTESIRNVMGEWKQQDPDAAKAAAETLPDDVRERLRGE